MGIKRVTLDDIGELQKKGQLKEAEAILHQILNSNPDNLAVLFTLGTNYGLMGCDGLAAVIMRFCLAIDEKQGSVWNNLGTTWRRLFENARALECFERAWALDKRADIASNASTVYVNEGNPGPGIEWARKGLELDPCKEHCNWNLALLLLESEQWEEGFKLYPWGLMTGDRQRKVYLKKPTIPWWDGTADRTIILYGEQGIGDEIMYASQMPEMALMHKRVIFDCHPRLLKMFEFAAHRVWPKCKDGEPIDCYPTRKLTDGSEEWVGSYSRIDAKISIADLPRFTRKRAEDFPRQPYLSVPLARELEAEEWINLLPGDGPPLGLAWVGGRRTTRKDLRSIMLHELLPVVKHAHDLGFKLIDMNYQDQGWEVETVKKELGITIHRFPEVFEHERWEVYKVRGIEFKNKFAAKNFCKAGNISNKEIVHIPGCGHDYMDTAAWALAITCLGGTVVTVNQSLVHLCGSLGASAIVLTPKRPAWRYGLKSSRFAWYGDHIIQYRCKEDDWLPVFAQTNEALTGLRRWKGPSDDYHRRLHDNSIDGMEHQSWDRCAQSGVG